MKSRDLPGHRTERFAAPVGTSWTTYDDHEVYDTPDNRLTWWGHRLVVDEPPDDLAPWLDRWREVHAGKGVERAMISWESRVRQVPPLPDGAEHEVLWTLMADESVDALPGPATVRSTGFDDHAALLELAIAAGDHGENMAWSIRGWLTRAERGEGELWGGWIGDRLAGVVGLFHDEREARTQWIATHPDHRRKGLCTQLLTHAVAYHQERRAGIVYTGVDADSDAERLYRSLGWRQVTALDNIVVPMP